MSLADVTRVRGGERGAVAEWNNNQEYSRTIVDSQQSSYAELAIAYRPANTI